MNKPVLAIGILALTFSMRLSAGDLVIAGAQIVDRTALHVISRRETDKRVRFEVQAAAQVVGAFACDPMDDATWRTALLWIRTFLNGTKDGFTMQQLVSGSGNCTRL